MSSDKTDTPRQSFPHETTPIFDLVAQLVLMENGEAAPRDESPTVLG
ncbi:hypothetical protein AB0N89_03870 [Amycolatopsis sp. NPDC089917]